MSTTILCHGFQVSRYGCDRYELRFNGEPLGRVLETNEMSELANAILAALGEPVEEKPDRSELDRQPQYKYAAIEGGKLLDRWNKDVPLETVIESAKGCTDKNFGVYEMIAFVGPKPSVERKVVRLD